MLWELIRINQRKTWWLFLGMGAILVSLGYFVTAAFIPDAGWQGVFVAVFIWVLLSLVSYFSGDSILLMSGNATEVSHDIHPQLFNVVEEMAIAANLKAVPRIFIISDPGLNAFAAGCNPEKSAIAVTAGLLARLNRDELQGVVAHEISHIFNRDSLFMTFAGVMLGSIQLISDAFFRIVRFGGHTGRYGKKSKSSSSKNAYLILIGLVLAVFGPILAKVLYFTISKKREFLADASAARLTRYPEGLASALEKIAAEPTFQIRDNRILTPFYIGNSVGEADFFGFWNTHPPIAERIQILRSMSGSADFFSYQRAYSRVTGRYKPLIPPVALYRKEVIPVRAPFAKDEAKQGNTGRIDQNVGDLMRAVNSYAFLNCDCGLRFKVPPEFAFKKITCPRCGKIHISAKSDIKPVSNLMRNESQNTEPQTYTRIGRDWESFNCACGRLIQLSPIFIASSIKCPGCGCKIKIIDSTKSVS